MVKEWVALNTEAESLCEDGEYQQAITVGQEALALAEQVHGSNHQDCATSLYNLAFAYDLDGDTDLANETYMRSLQIREQVLGEQNPAVAEIILLLAGNYEDEGQTQLAEDMYQRALIIFDTSPGGKVASERTDVMVSLAHLYKANEKFELAEPLFRELVELDNEDGDVKILIGTMNDLVEVLQSQGKYKEAEEVQNDLNDLSLLDKLFDGQAQESKNYAIPIIILILAFIISLYFIF
ncbi:MAG: tetratricopeptide repeat protein [Planctomycetes bacterium]|nr:tetratricopeptide repeat protein [Planctomycetota bacterium]